jgi:AcrR family transcriptional regulator
VSDLSVTEKLAGRAVERSVSRRRAEYSAEMARIVETTFTLVQKSGSLETSMRDILRATGLSTQAFYKYFASKDELMLALLDEGRRKLIELLGRRMAPASTPAEEIRAWIEGVLAQSTNATAAARTRPWVLSEQRLMEHFPEEQRSSVDLLVGLLDAPVRRLRGRGATDEEVRESSAMIYRLSFATLREHLVSRTKPTAQQTSALVEFCLRGVALETTRRS